MKKTQTYFGLLTYLLLSINVYALDLKEAYELAYKNDATTNAARARANSDREALPQAKAQLMPNISFTYNKSRIEQQRSIDGVDQPKQNFPSMSQSLSIRQPIFRANLFANYVSANAEVENAEAVLTKNLQDMATRVTEAYLNTLLAQDRLNLVTVQKDLYSKQYDSALKAFKAGFGVKTDIDAYRASIDRIIASEISVQQQIDYSKQQLEYYISQPVRDVASFNPEFFRSDQFVIGQLEDWISLANQSNNELKALKANIDIAEAQIKVKFSGHLPTLDLVAQYTKSESESMFFVGQEINSRSVGLQLNVPIFAGGYNNSLVREAQAKLEEAQFKYQETNNRVLMDIKRNYNALKEGVAQIYAIEQSLKSDEQLVVSNKKGVIAGTRTVLDVLNSENQKFDTMLKLAQARYGFLQSWVALNALAGQANIELITEVNRNFKSN